MYVGLAKMGPSTSGHRSLWYIRRYRTVHVHLWGFIDPSPTKQEVKWESQAEWKEPSERESKEAGGVQDPKLLRRGGSGSEDRESAADPEQGSKTIKGEEDPVWKRK